MEPPQIINNIFSVQSPESLPGKRRKTQVLPHCEEFINRAPSAPNTNAIVSGPAPSPLNKSSEITKGSTYSDVNAHFSHQTSKPFFFLNSFYVCCISTCERNRLRFFSSLLVSYAFCVWNMVGGVANSFRNLCGSTKRKGLVFFER